MCIPVFAITEIYTLGKSTVYAILVAFAKFYFAVHSEQIVPSPNFLASFKC